MTTYAIRRYPNRRYYSTDESRYVTLVDIGEHWDQGENIRSIDWRTKTDITIETLLELVLQRVRAGVLKLDPIQLQVLKTHDAPPA